MELKRRLAFALFFLRISVFLFMLIWTVDEYFLMGHSDIFYLKHLLFIFGTILLICFLIGFRKRVSYGLVFIIQAISTVLSSKEYLVLFDSNLLAAWPLLAACFALYYLRDNDTLFTLKDLNESDA